MVCSKNMPSFGRVKKGEGKEERGGGAGEWSEGRKDIGEPRIKEYPSG